MVPDLSDVLGQASSPPWMCCVLWTLSHTQGLSQGLYMLHKTECVRDSQNDNVLHQPSKPSSKQGVGRPTHSSRSKEGQQGVHR